MSYKIKLSERLDEGIRRIGLEQIDAAVKRLRGHGDPASVVHATRKTLKKLRSLLRLARPGLPQAVYSEENARYRDIGRLMSGARDAQVMSEMLESLHESSDGRTKAAIGAVRTRLSMLVKRSAAAAGTGTVAETPELFAEVRSRLAEGRVAMEELPIESGRLHVAFDGMEMVYRRARRAMNHAFTTLDDVDMHEFRKQAQHHWRHMQLVSAAWPEFFDARVVTARNLSQILGEVHDLAVLQKFLESATDARLTKRQRDIVFEVAASRQSDLRQDAYALAHRLFAEPPGAFRDHVVVYWQAARDEPPAALAAE